MRSAGCETGGSLCACPEVQVLRADGEGGGGFSSHYLLLRLKMTIGRRASTVAALGRTVEEFRARIDKILAK